MVEERALIEGIKPFYVEVIPREENQEDDALSRYDFGVSLWLEVHCVENETPSIIEENKLLGDTH